jgi:hypothetical protein
MRTALLVATLLFGVACKRDQPSGLPPGGEWEQPQQGMAPPRNPNDPANPTSAKMGGSPHGGMGGGGDGVPTGPMPNDDVHSGMGGGGGAGVPPNHPPMSGDPAQGGGGGPAAMAGVESTAPRALEKQSDGRYILGPFTLAVPAEWSVKPVTKGMRAAHFVLSDKAGEEAELIVYYQGEGGMGPVKDNLDRWAGQVKGTPTIEQVKFAGQDAHYMTIHGDYANETTGAAGKAQTVIGVIVQSPTGPYYFKLVGARKTVEPQVAKVKAMFDSLKLKS